MRRTTRLSLLLLLAASACGKKEPAPEAKPAETAKPAEAKPAEAARPAADPPAQPAAAATSAQPAPAVALPGPCVDPAADAAKRLSSEISQGTGDPPYAQPGPDVDGDGAPDRLLSIGAGYTTNTLVYVMRGTCGHFVGDVGAPPKEADKPTRSNGLLDLRTPEVSSCEGSRCGCEPGESWYRFDGKEYQFDKKASTQSREKPCND